MAQFVLGDLVEQGGIFGRFYALCQPLVDELFGDLGFLKLDDLAANLFA